MKNYYQILGLPKFADLDQVKEQYRELVKKYHPDLNKAKGAKEKFLAIQEAYEALETPELKRSYDQKLKWGKRTTVKTSVKKPTYNRNLRPIDFLKKELKSIRNEIARNDNFSHYDLVARLQNIVTPEFAEQFVNSSTAVEKEESYELLHEFIDYIDFHPFVVELLRLLMIIVGQKSKHFNGLAYKYGRYKSWHFPAFGTNSGKPPKPWREKHWTDKLIPILNLIFLIAIAFFILLKILFGG